MSKLAVPPRSSYPLVNTWFIISLELIVYTLCIGASHVLHPHVYLTFYKTFSSNCGRMSLKKLVYIGSLNDSQRSKDLYNAICHNAIPNVQRWRLLRNYSHLFYIRTIMHIMPIKLSSICKQCFIRKHQLI